MNIQMTETKCYTSLDELMKDPVPDLSGNVEHPFLKDLGSFHQEKKHYYDDHLLRYDTSDMDAIVNEKIRKGEYFPFGDSLKGDTTQGTVTGYHANDKIGASLQEELHWDKIANDNPWMEEITKLGFGTHLGYHNNEDVLIKGELTAPIAESIEEKGIEQETNWFCKGCSKYFTTKSSLKRHHDRKKSCKEICEKPPEEAANSTIVPEKPYIVDWIDQTMIKSISGDSDKPYCKHCDVEFANKSNLNKHLTKSVACDKLAKQEFVKLIHVV